MGITLHPPIRLDLSWPDVMVGWLGLLAQGDGAALLRQAEEAWISAEPHSHACCALSVRSAFDLLLSALRFPPGSAILMTAVTVPGMPLVARWHGLEVVPVDIDPATLAPKAQALERALAHPRARMLVVAHLLGSRLPLDTIAAKCAACGVMLVEDAAQAWRGDEWRGHPGALASLFSFGTIKTATALGGAMATIRDPALCDAMRTLRNAQPVQPWRAAWRRVAVGSTMKLLGHPMIYGAFSATCDVLGFNPRPAMARATRGFGAGQTPEDLMGRLRQRPAPALLQLLRRRITNRASTQTHVDRRRRRGEALSQGWAGVARMDGMQAPEPTHWVLAIHPVPGVTSAELRTRLRREGFDATAEASSMSLIEGGDCPGAHAMLEEVLYLQPPASQPPGAGG